MDNMILVNPARIKQVRANLVVIAGLAALSLVAAIYVGKALLFTSSWLLGH